MKSPCSLVLASTLLIAPHAAAQPTAAQPAVAQPAPEAPPDDDGPIATDRPGNGNAATTVPKGRFQFEASANYLTDETAGFETRLINFPTLFRFGVTGFLELRAGTGIVGIVDSPNGTGDSPTATDTLLGTKLQISSSDGAVPDLSAMVDVFLPTGNDAFTSDAVVPEARLAAAWSLPAGFGLLLNAGAVVPEDAAGDRRAQFLYVTNVGYTLPVLDERASIFVESFGLVPLSGESDDQIQVDAGAAYLAGHDWQVDFFTQHGITDAAPDFQFAAGLSGRF